MTREDFKQQLQSRGFKGERFSEYHNDVFRHETYRYKGSRLFIEVFVNYYNVRLVWWHQKGRKVAKNYYVGKELRDYKNVEELISDFVDCMTKDYGIKIIPHIVK